MSVCLLALSGCKKIEKEYTTSPTVTDVKWVTSGGAENPQSVAPGEEVVISCKAFSTYGSYMVKTVYWVYPTEQVLSPVFWDSYFKNSDGKNLNLKTDLAAGTETDYTATIPAQQDGNSVLWQVQIINSYNIMGGSNLMWYKIEAAADDPAQKTPSAN